MHGFVPKFGYNVDKEIDCLIVDRILSRNLIANDDKLEFDISVFVEDGSGQFMKSILTNLVDNVVIKAKLLNQIAADSLFLSGAARRVLKRYLASRNDE